VLPLGLAVGDVHQARSDADRRLLLTWGRGAGHRLPPVLAQVQRVGAQHGEDALPLPDASTDLLRGEGTGHGPQGRSRRRGAVSASPPLPHRRPGSGWGGGHPPTFPFLVRICLQWSQPSFLTALNGTSERSEVECLLERASSAVPRLSRDCGGTAGHGWGDAIGTPRSAGVPTRQSNPGLPSDRGTQAGDTPGTPNPCRHPTLTPSVKKLLSMRRLGTRLGILLGGEHPRERDGGEGTGPTRWWDRGGGFQLYLRIFPSSRNAFRPSSQDLERSVVMARR